MITEDDIKKLEKLGYLEIIRDKKDPDYNPKYTAVRLTQKYKDEFT